MFEVADDRHFQNPFPDFDKVQWKPDESDIQCKRHIAKNLKPLVDYLCSKVGTLPSSKTSMYTGLAGIGLFFNHLATINNNLIDDSLRKTAKDFAIDITKRCLSHLDLRQLSENISVFTGPIGPLCLGTLVGHKIESSRSVLMSEQCLDEIQMAAKYALSLQSEMPDEALYGRTGYLNALLTLQSVGVQIPREIVAQVVDTILKSGIQTAHECHKTGQYRVLMRSTSKSDIPMPPLMFQWHEKAYLGGAHGFAGILTTLLRVSQMAPDALPPDSLDQLILPTAKWLGRLQMPSGNWPSSLGSSLDRDVLVHWCHGATGVVQLMISAYKVSQVEEYLERALNGGEAIWARGLLYKGCGLCHGSAGSGYALLELYQLTKDPKYLYRAYKFAEWCTDCFKNRKREADRPFSLFEGLAGTLYFLVDMLDPYNARFPLLNGV